MALARLLFDKGKNRHVTAESLHEETQRSETKVSLATVYNTLHQFTRAGLLREIVVESSKTYFDTNTSIHHRFFNAAAATLTDIDADEVQLVSVPAAPDGVHIDRVEVIFQEIANYFGTALPELLTLVLGVSIVFTSYIRAGIDSGIQSGFNVGDTDDGAPYNDRRPQCHSRIQKLSKT